MYSPAKRIIISLLTFFIPFTSFSQRQVIGATHSGMANITTVETKELYFQNNASLLAFTQSKTLNTSTHYSYLSSDITTHSIGFSTPLKNKNNLGFNITRDGIPSFNTTNLGVSYGKLLSENFAIGLKTEIQYLHIDKRYTKFIVLPEISIAGKHSKNWGYSMILVNPTRQSYNKELYYNSPSQLIIGGNYSKENYLLAMEINKKSEEPILVSWGGLYTLSTNVFLSFGFKTNTSISGGFTYKHQLIRVSFASTYHSTLGFSPTLSLRYDFINKT